EDATIEQIYGTMEREIDFICNRIALPDIEMWAAQFDPEQWIEKLRGHRNQVLSAARRDAEVALWEMTRKADITRTVRSVGPSYSGDASLFEARLNTLWTSHD